MRKKPITKEIVKHMAALKKITGAENYWQTLKRLEVFFASYTLTDFSELEKAVPGIITDSFDPQPGEFGEQLEKAAAPFLSAAELLDKKVNEQVPAPDFTKEEMSEFFPETLPPALEDILPEEELINQELINQQEAFNKQQEEQL